VEIQPNALRPAARPAGPDGLDPAQRPPRPLLRRGLFVGEWFVEGLLPHQGRRPQHPPGCKGYSIGHGPLMSLIPIPMAARTGRLGRTFSGWAGWPACVDQTGSPGLLERGRVCVTRIVVSGAIGSRVLGPGGWLQLVAAWMLRSCIPGAGGAGLVGQIASDYPCLGASPRRLNQETDPIHQTGGPP